jgi:c-di-GMP-binding flagellar brake protein YcgR
MIEHSGNRAVVRFSSDSSSQSGGGSDQRRLRRRTIRKTCHVRVEFAVGFSSGGAMHMDTHKTRGKLLDLSSGGACVMTKYDIAPGQEVTLHIDLQEKTSIKPRAQVRWTKHFPEKKGFACGVQFHPLDDEDKRRLRWFLDELDQQVGGSEREDT